MSTEHDGGTHPKRAWLEGLISDGSVDTLVVALTDMQGRLMGKRVQGQAFLGGAIDHGAHFCTYLLGTDMEMNTPDGFELMNWETGYGDWIADPVWDTLRVVPWLEKTAIVLSDTVDHHGDEIPVSPRTMLKRVVRARHEAGLPRQGRLRARVLPADRYLRAGLAQGLRRPRPLRLLQRGLPPAAGDQGRADPRQAAQPDDAGRHPGRVQQGRSGARPARGQHPLRPRAGDGRPHGALQARRQGDRLPERLRADLHGQAGSHLDRLIGSPAHQPLGRERRGGGLLRARAPSRTG